MTAGCWLNGQGPGLTAKDLLCIPKFPSNQWAVTPMYATLLDDVHMSVVTEWLTACAMLSFISSFTTLYLSGTRVDDMDWRVGKRYRGSSSCTKALKLALSNRRNDRPSLQITSIKKELTRATFGLAVSYGVVRANVDDTAGCLRFSA